MSDNLPMLPDDFVSALAKGIADSRAATPYGFGGKPLLRMMKSGQWVFGANNEEVQDGSTWVVNPMSLRHGWSCWVEGVGKNTLKGEVMSMVTQALPPQPPEIEGTAYKPQKSMELKCLDGDDAGTEVLYKCNSYGGLKAFDALLLEFHKRIPIERVYLCPTIQLGHDHYTHPQWGRVETPEFTLTGWVDINGRPPNGGVPLEASVQTVQTVQAAPGAPVRKRKEPLGVVEGGAAAAPTEPQPTAQAHVGQRRRPLR